MEENDVLEKRKRFFEERSSHCPETKLEMQEVIEEAKSVNKNQKRERIFGWARKERSYTQVMAEIQEEKERAGQEERLEKKEPRKLFMRWEYH